jgi:hypothetical protein
MQQSQKGHVVAQGKASVGGAAQTDLPTNAAVYASVALQLGLIQFFDAGSYMAKHGLTPLFFLFYHIIPRM